MCGGPGNWPSLGGREDWQANAAALSFFAQDLGHGRLASPATGSGTTGFGDSFFRVRALTDRGANRTVSHTLTMANDHSCSSFGGRLRHPLHKVAGRY